MIFKDCRVPKENLLGKEGMGLQMAMTGFDHGRIGIAAQCVGILQAALDESIRYSKERVQFGISHRPPSGHCLDDRRHGNGSGRRPIPHLSCRLAQGSEAALQQGSRHGQTLCIGGGDETHHQGGPDPRRIRLLQGRQGGAADARRQDHGNLRGHLGSPAHGDFRKCAALRLTALFPCRSITNALKLVIRLA